MNLSGGVAMPASMTVGSAGKGTFVQTGGSLGVAGNVYIAKYQNSTGSMTIQGGNFTMTSQNLIFNNGGITSGLGASASMSIQGGTVAVPGIDIGHAGSVGSNALTVTGGVLNLGSAGLFRAGANAPYSITLSGGTVGALSAWSSALDMTMGTSAATGGNFNGGAGGITLSGLLSGPGGLSTSGGLLTLTRSDTYTGATRVNAGTLALSGTASFTASPTIAVAALATLDVSAKTGGFHLLGSQTLSGNGSVVGAATIDAGASVAPGDTGPGTLTFANGLDMSASGGSANMAWRLGTLSISSGFDSLLLTGGNLALGGLSKITLDFSLLSADQRPDSPSLHPFWYTDETWKVVGLSGLAANSGNTKFGSVSVAGGALTNGSFSTYVGTGADSGSVFLKYTAVSTAPNQWKDLNGSWNSTSNWTDGMIPNGTGAVATFGTIATTNRAVTVDSPVTVGALAFNSSHTYTVSGGTIEMKVTSGSAAINVLGGSHEISAPLTLTNTTVVTVTSGTSALSVSGPIGGTGGLTKSGSGQVILSHANTFGGSVAVSAGTLEVKHEDAIPAGRDLSISNGAAVTVSRTTGGSLYGKAVQVGALNFANGTSTTGVLDMKQSELVIDGTKTSYNTVKALMLVGAAVPPYDPDMGAQLPMWNGPSINSSVAAADGLQYRTLAYARNSDLGDPYTGAPWLTWRGRTVNSDSVIVRYTYYGDANLDGQVTLDDYYNWKSGYNADPPGSLELNWFWGNYNFDDKVDVDDYYVWKSSYNADPPLPLLPGDAIPDPSYEAGAASATAVPEPGTVTLLAAGALACLWQMLRRRRPVQGSAS
jgi:fibronectin-binding autotransporter adhesin